MANVIEINRLEDLQHYRMAWNALFSETPRASFFHTFDWLVKFWEDADPTTRFRILVIRVGDAITGIVPLCIVTERHRLQSLRVLTYPLGDWGTCYGPIGPNQSASLFMAMRYLRYTPRDWDRIDLRWTARESLSDEATGRAMRAAGWTPHIEPYQTTSLVEFSDRNWDDYLVALPAKTRQEILRQRRRVERCSCVEFVRHRPAPAVEGDGDPNWALFEECLEISRNSWQANASDGKTLSHNGVVRFLQECHAAAARLGMLDVAVLRIDGHPVAFQYNYIFDGHIQGLRMGYVQEERSGGVGTVLLSYMLQDSFARQDRSLDLGAGEYQFKRKLRTRTRTTWHYTYAPWRAWKSHGVSLSGWIHRQVSDRVTTRTAKAASA